MTAAVIGALRVDLAMNAGEFKKGANAAAKSLRDLQKTVDKTVKQIQAGFAAFFTGRGLGALVSLVDESLEAVNALDRLSQTSGISIERLSELKGVAAAAGIEFNIVEQAVKGLAQRLAEGLAQPASNVSIAFRELGISARDSAGNLRTFDDLLPDVADKFVTFSDGVAKAQLATALFGEEAGPRLIPLLNQGSAGIERLREEVRKSGLVLNDEGVRRAREYQQATTQMKDAVTALATEFAIKLAPAVTTVAQAITKLIGLLPQVDQEAFQGIRTNDTLNRLIQAQEAALNELNEANKNRLKWLGITNVETEKAIEIAKKNLQALKEELETLTILNDMKANQPQLAAPPDLAGQKAAIDAMRAQLDEQMALIGGQRPILPFLLYGDAMSPDAHVGDFQRAMDAINAATQSGAVTAQQAGKMKRKLAQEEQGYILDTASLAASTISEVFQGNKLAAIGAAIINTAVAVTKALQLPFPFNWAQAALVVASGAAQIAAIRSANERGGGSAASTGGGGGSSGPAPPAEQPVSRSLTVQGIDCAAFFSGDALADLVGRINDFVKDGGYLISTQNLPV